MKDKSIKRPMNGLYLTMVGRYVYMNIRRSITKAQSCEYFKLAQRMKHEQAHEYKVPVLIMIYLGGYINLT